MSRALCDRQELPRLALPRTTHFAPMTTLNYISIQHNVTWIDSTGGNQVPYRIIPHPALC